MVPQHAGARRPSCSTPGCTHGARILDAGCGPGRQRRVAGRRTATSSASTSPPDALAFVRARRPTTRPVRASVEALPFTDGAYDVVVGLTVLYTVPDDAARRRRAGAGAPPRRRAAPRGARVRRPRAGPRRHRARPAPLPSARARRRSPPRPASPSQRAHVRVLLPRAARRRARGTRPGAPPARRPRGLRRRQARARPRVRAAGRRASAAGWPPTTSAVRDLAWSCSLPADRHRSAAAGGARPAAPRARRGPDSVRRMAPSRKNSDFP